MSKNVMFWVLHNLFASKCCKKERRCSLGIWSNEVIYIYINIYIYIYYIRDKPRNDGSSAFSGRFATWHTWRVWHELRLSGTLQECTAAIKVPKWMNMEATLMKCDFYKNGSEVAKQRARQSLMETTILHVMVSYHSLFCHNFSHLQQLVVT